MNKNNKGIIYAIGGAMEMSAENAIVKNMAETSVTKCITVIPSYATDKKIIEALYIEYKGLFSEALGFKFSFIMPDETGSIETNENIKVIEGTDFLFLSGGSQRQLTKMLLYTETLEIIKNKYFNEGLVIAGTSAGCAALSQVCILGGNDEPKIGEGLGLLPAFIMDQHFSTGNQSNRIPRLPRLKKAVQLYKNCIGIGVDENTCVKFTDEKNEVIGEDTVTTVTYRKGNLETCVYRSGQILNLNV